VRTAGGLLFSGRRFGLRKHFFFEDLECQRIVRRVEKLIENGTKGRQWHCVELLRTLRKTDSSIPREFDSYSLNISLELFSTLHHLGRMVWVASSATTRGRLRRRDVAEMCEAALRRAGRPLTKTELRAEIEKTRGLNGAFLLLPSSKIARMGGGLWGLVERDFCMSEVDRDRTMAALARLLLARGKPIRISELGTFLDTSGITLPPGVSARMVAGLAQADRRFGVRRRKFIGLAQGDAS
jgi:hypothetical protein